MEGILLVDGYNVLNAWPELAALKEVELAHARDRLITILSDFQAFSGVRVILVFDAYNVKGMLGNQEILQDIEVVYTKEGETADEWIERFAAKHRENNRSNTPLFVTTSDWLEQRIVSAHGAYRVTPRELLHDYQQLKLDLLSYNRQFNYMPLDSHLPENTRNILEKWRRRK